MWIKQNTELSKHTTGHFLSPYCHRSCVIFQSGMIRYNEWKPSNYQAAALLMWCFPLCFPGRPSNLLLLKQIHKKRQFLLLNEGQRFFLRLGGGVSLTCAVYYSTQHTAEAFHFFLVRSSNGPCLTSWSRFALMIDAHTIWALLSACFFLLNLFISSLCFFVCVSLHTC